MSIRRLFAISLRYFYASRDPNRLAELLFWPMIDIGVYGLIATWTSSLAKDPGVTSTFITALILWQVVYRAHYEICVNVMDEFLDRNLLNLIASPLKKSEWVFSMMMSGFCKVIFTLFFGAFVGYLFFGVNIFSCGVKIIPLIIFCILSGWIIGFITGGVILTKGARFQQLPWVVIIIAALFSAIFYPMSILPAWMKIISQALPMSYIFQGMRTLLLTGNLTVGYTLMSTLLCILYLALAIKFFLHMFEKGRQQGFNQLS